MTRELPPSPTVPRIRTLSLREKLARLRPGRPGRQRHAAGRALTVLLRVVIAGVFLAAAADKIVHPDRFADVVSDYQILPAWLVNLFAVCLPWVEVVVGLALLVGLWVPEAALLALGMTLMFMLALAINLARGNTNLHCGCFSTSQEGPGSAWDLLWRDAILMVACAGLLWATCPAGLLRALVSAVKRS